MSEFFSHDQALARVLRLTRSQMTALIEVGAVHPAPGDPDQAFGPADLARLELLCDLAEMYDMDPEALALTIRVIDQMHRARRDRDLLLAALRAEADEVRARVLAVLVQAGAVGA